MHEVEAAYWRFARELKGQSAMAPYNQAYEALAGRVRPRQSDPPATPIVPEEAPQAEAAQAEVAPEKIAPVARPPSKFGWPAR